MPERGGFFERMFGGKKEKQEEDLNKLSDYELKQRANWTITGKPDNDAARAYDARVKAASASVRPEVKPAEPKSEPVKEAEYIPPQKQSPPPLKYKPDEKIIDAVDNGKGEFVTDADKTSSASAIKYESDSFIVQADNVPKKFNPDRQLEPGEDKRLVRQGNRAVARQYEKPQYQPRPVKGLIEQGQGKEVILRPKMEVMKVDKPEPIPIPPDDEKFEKKLERVQLADIDAIVESYAQRVAEKKLGERMEGSNLATRWFVRLAEDGYYKKYFDEAKQEIMKNHNLLSQIETRWFKKSEGAPLRADASDIHYEILDKVVEAFDKQLLEERSTEVKAQHIRNMNVDLEAGRLFADFALGKVTDRSQFDRLVEERVVPNVPGAKTDGRMYASNLYRLAEQYRQEVDNHLRTVGKELGPEQEAYVNKFFEKTLSLDIQLGEKNRDMAQRLPGDTMKGFAKFEKYVDLSQNTFFKGNSRTGRTAAKIVANPILYAAVGGLAARGLTKGAAVGIVSALTFGSATAVIVGTGIGAGIYMGFRAARERRRDIMKGEKEAVLGQKERQTHELKEARNLITQVEALQAKGVPLTNEEKQQVADIRATLLLQTEKKVDLISVGKEEGNRAQTKLIAETDLRKALKDFWQAKRGEFGATEPEQQRAYDRLVGVAEQRMIPEIDRVNKEVAKEIRERGIKMGLMSGAAAAVMTGVFGGYVTRGIEHAHDKMFGGNWSGNKATWIEALRDRITGAHHADYFHGPVTDHAPGFMNGHAELNLPGGYQAHDIVSGGNHYLNLTGPDGHVIPGAEHIAVGPDGKILDVGALNALRSHGWNIQENVTTRGGSGGGGSSPFSLNKIHRVDWHDEPGAHYSTIHGRDILYEGKQQELFLNDTGGNVHADVHMVAKNLIDNIQHKFAEFGKNPDSSVDTKLSGLEAKLMEWYKHGGVDEVQSHLKINIIPTADNNIHNMGMMTAGAHNGEIDLSSLNSVLKAPGTTLHDGGLGVDRMELGIDNGGDWHVLATASGHDSVLPSGEAASNFYQYNLRPPTPEDIEYPFPLAGNRRELNKDAEQNTKERLDRLNPKKPEQPKKADVKDKNNTGKAVAGAAVVGAAGVAAGAAAEARRVPFDQAVQEVFYGQKPVEKMNWDDAVQEVFYGIKTPANKQRPVTMEDFYGTNTAENRASTIEAEKSSREKAVDSLRSRLNAQTLTEADVDKAAREFKISKMELLIGCLEAGKVNYQRQEAQALRAAQLGRTDENRAIVLWQILERVMMEGAPKRTTTPEPVIKRTTTRAATGATPGKPMPGTPAPSSGSPSPERQPRPRPARAEAAPTAQEAREEADLAEALTGKFSRLNVNISGDGQNKFATMSEGKRITTVRAYERALKTMNAKLEKAKVKGKIRMEIGGKFVPGSRVIKVPVDTTERGLIKFMTDELVKQKILPKEGAPEAKKKL
jgi:hypothetical protein